MSAPVRGTTGIRRLLVPALVLMPALASSNAPVQRARPQAPVGAYVFVTNEGSHDVTMIDARKSRIVAMLLKSIAERFGPPNTT